MGYHYVQSHTLDNHCNCLPSLVERIEQNSEGGEERPEHSNHDPCYERFDPVNGRREEERVWDKDDQDESLDIT
jgi:hypothetical protein